MGFLDKLKGTAKQMANPGQLAGQRDGIMRLNEVGVERQATVRSATKLGSAFGGDEFEFDLEVADGNGGSYPVTARQSMHGSASLSAGDRITVKVDPENPQSLLIWSGAQ